MQKAQFDLDTYIVHVEITKQLLAKNMNFCFSLRVGPTFSSLDTQKVWNDQHSELPGAARQSKVPQATGGGTKSDWRLFWQETSSQSLVATLV